MYIYSSSYIAQGSVHILHEVMLRELVLNALSGHLNQRMRISSCWFIYFMQIDSWNDPVYFCQPINAVASA